MTPKERLQRDRPGRVHKVVIGGQKVYIRTGEYEDGRLGEVFITIDKEGCKLRVYDALGILLSIGLQHGVPLADYVDKLSGLRYDPQGVTSNPEIPFVKSIADYLAKWLEARYIPKGERDHGQGSTGDEERSTGDRDQRRELEDKRDDE